MRADARVLIVAALVALPLNATAAQSAGPLLRRRAVHAVADVKVWNAFGSIRLVGWDKDSIVLRGSVSRTRRVLWEGGAAAMKIGVEGNFASDDSSRSDIIIYVPRTARVAVKSVAADIAATDVTGWFYTASGNVRLAGSATSATVESVGGSLDLDVSAPFIKAQTGEGRILLRGSVQDADVSTIGGTINVASSSLMRGQFSSVSGAIHYAGAPASGAVLEFSDHAGDVDLSLPSSTSAALMLTSVSGVIENGFTGVRPVSSTPRSMRLNLGSGSAQLTVRTFKGAIRLRAQP